MTIETERPDGSEGWSIAMVCARYPPFVGGTETHVAEVSRRLVERGQNVTVITTVLHRAAVGDSNEAGVRVIRVLARPKSSDLHLAPDIHRILRRTRPDLVHVQGYHTLVAPIAMASAITTGVPFVVTFHSGGHSSRLRRMTRPIQHRFLKLMLGRARYLIGVSAYETAMFRQILGLPDDLYVTITNGVSDEFAPVEAQRERRPIVLSVGRLEAYKRHDLAIAAIARVRHQIPDVRLRIVGAGPELDRLRRLARHHYVEDLVEFSSMPVADRRGMAAAMQEASVVTLMSTYESQGIVGLEALASGCRLIVADGSALEELATYDAATVLHDVRPEAVAAAIVDRLRDVGPHTSAAVPSWDETTSALQKIYRSAFADPC